MHIVLQIRFSISATGGGILLPYRIWCITYLHYRLAVRALSRCRPPRVLNEVTTGSAVAWEMRLAANERSVNSGKWCLRVSQYCLVRNSMNDPTRQGCQKNFGGMLICLFVYLYFHLAQSTRRWGRAWKVRNRQLDRAASPQTPEIIPATSNTTCIWKSRAKTCLNGAPIV